LERQQRQLDQELQEVGLHACVCISYPILLALRRP
jgi:hypothetical protein